jgi:hypothetical protein
MDPRVEILKTVKECDTFSINAMNNNRFDLVHEACERRVQLNTENYTGEIKNEAERSALRAIYAYEECLRQKNSKTTRANRTWQAVKKHGILGAIERLVHRNNAPMGYQVLNDVGLSKYSFESVVVNYPIYFTDETVFNANERLLSFV